MGETEGIRRSQQLRQRRRPFVVDGHPPGPVAAAAGAGTGTGGSAIISSRAGGGRPRDRASGGGLRPNDIGARPAVGGRAAGQRSGTAAGQQRRQDTEDSSSDSAAPPMCTGALTTVDHFTLNGTAWTACEDLAAPGGALALLSADGSAEWFSKSHEPYMYILTCVYIMKP